MAKTPAEVAGYVAEIERVTMEFIPDAEERFVVLGAALASALCDVAADRRGIVAADHVMGLTHTLAFLASVATPPKGQRYDA